MALWHANELERSSTWVTRDSVSSWAPNPTGASRDYDKWLCKTSWVNGIAGANVKLIKAINNNFSSSARECDTKICKVEKYGPRRGQMSSESSISLKPICDIFAGQLYIRTRRSHTADVRIRAIFSTETWRLPGSKMSAGDNSQEFTEQQPIRSVIKSTNGRQGKTMRFLL